MNDFVRAPIDLVAVVTDGSSDASEKVKEVFINIRKLDIMAWYGDSASGKTRICMCDGREFFVNISEIEFLRRMQNES